LEGIISNAMTIKIISSREEINWLEPNEKAVYFLFRPSSVDFVNLILKSPRLQMIQVPPPHTKNIPKSIRTFLEILDIDVLECDLWDHMEYSEYFTNSDEAVISLNQ
jgi:hypothetical protein